MRLALLFVVGGYVLIVGVIAAMQGRMIYPSAGQGPAPTAGDLDAIGARPLPGVAAQAAFVVEAQGAAWGTAVVFHGNGGTALDRSYYVRALGARGLRVVLAEYPGYGGRPGSPSEAALVKDGAATVRAVREQFDGPVIVWGESLGAGVAAAVVAQIPDGAVDAVVLVTPWDSLVETARASFGWLPVGLLLRDRYDSVANLSGFEGPVAVAVAERDQVIATERGVALFDALGAPKRLWTFAGAGHNTWPTEQGAAWWDEVIAFTRPASP